MESLSGNKDVDQELVWHMDKRDREVRILEGWWKLLDNDIPRDLIIGETYRIPKIHIPQSMER